MTFRPKRQGFTSAGRRGAGRSTVAAVALVASAGACSQDPRSAAPPPVQMGQVRSWNAAALPLNSVRVTLDPEDFSTTIDNPYFPLQPRTRWVYRQADGDRGVTVIVVTVTTETKLTADGVTARIVRDTVTEDGSVVEDSFDWYAQDTDGTVWYLGEDTAEFEEGRMINRSGSFEAGVDGAMAGVAMPGFLKEGQRYRQEYSQGEAEDNGRILSTTVTASVPEGRFEDVVLTQDTTTLEPGLREHKLYAPGVGNVLSVGDSGEDVREELVHTSTVSRRQAWSAGVVPLGERY